MQSRAIIVKPTARITKDLFGNVAVLMGGCAAERDISINGGTAVLAALKRLNIKAFALDVKTSPIYTLADKNIDRVFNIIHGYWGEDGVLQAFLELIQIPYSGSGVMACALTMDKVRTKLCWQGAGLTTPKWFVLKDKNTIDDCIEYLGFPLIIKPIKEGSSLGINKAHNKAELIQAWHVAKDYKCGVFVEEWVTGKEYTVAILDSEALPIIGLETTNKFYDFEAKYHSNSTQYHCPCGLSRQQEKQLKDLALTACDVVDISGWARVDMFLDDTNTIQLIEVNTVPGMTDSSLVPMAAKAVGIEFDELVLRILKTSLHAN